MRQQPDGHRADEREGDQRREPAHVASRRVVQPADQHRRHRLGPAAAGADAHHAPAPATPSPARMIAMARPSPRVRTSSAAISGITMYSPPSPIPNTIANSVT